MSTIPITEKLLLKAGGWDAMKPARELHKAGRVAQPEYNAPLLTGMVQEGGRTYRAGLRIKTAVDVENLCTCKQSRSWGTICAHSVAVGLAHLSPPPAAEKSAAPAATPTEARMTSHAPRPQFVRRAEDARGSAALHIILPPNFSAAWAKGPIMIVVEAETGGKRTLVSALPKTASFSCDDADIVAAAALTEFPTVFDSGMATLTRDEFLRLLVALRDHPRVTFGKSAAAVIGSATSRPRLEVTRRGASAVTAGLQLPKGASLLMGSSDAWLLHNERFSALGDVPVDWLKRFEQPVVLQGDRLLRFYAVELPQLRRVFDVQPDETLATPAVEQATPKFHLRINGSLSRITAELSSTYRGQAPVSAGAKPDETFAFADDKNPSRILTRDIAAERAAVVRLKSAGFEAEAAGNPLVLEGQARVLRFFAVHLRLLEREWDVVVEARVQKSVSEIERVTPKLEIVGSGEDWFELRYSLSTPAGQEFSGAEMQRLLRSGQTQTRLRNGHVAVFDPDALEDFEQVIRDCDPMQTQPGLYRISRAHAGYLDATAEESGFTIAGRLESLRNFLAPAPQSSPQLGSLAAVLREYQLRGVEWLTRLATNNLGGILADEMGLGKTVQTLAYLRAAKEGAPALIVCPTSLVANWQDEAKKFTPEMKTLVLEGPDRASRFGQIAAADIVITSYALLRRDVDELRKFVFSTAVLDEAQHIKNPDTQNAQAAYALRAKHRFVLTGTPMENSVCDLWSIMNFAMPGYLGSRADFRERYEQPLTGGAAPDVQRRLSRRLQPFLLRRRKRDVAKDLPDKIEQVVPCDLTSAQRGAYDTMLREIQQGLGTNRDAANAGAQRMKMLTGLLRLRQICCDLRLVGLEKAGAEPSAKLDLLHELLEEAIDGGHRVLVFSQFVSMLQLVRERLERAEVRFAYLDGATKERQEAVNRFQADAGIPVFLISLKAGGVGLNLSAADTVIHFDPWWNPAVEAQATDRAHRIGQTRVVTAYKLIARDTVEEKILRLQEKKRAAIDAAVESEEPLMSGLSTAELEELLA